MTHVTAFVDDLFFSTKIRETAKYLGTAVTFVRSLSDLKFAPDVFLVDLSRPGAVEMVRQIGKDPDMRKARLIGFCSHVQTDLKQKALDAGCNTVMPRSVFFQRLPELLK